ncbi:EAL domain-containing protein [Treponema sp.]|uniref:two-component system response regulator n=1 Tax=Treponema sp. TaxID=166 RepID=UPI00388FFF5A
MASRTDFKRTVLVVDDEKVNQKMFSDILSHSYNVITVESGSEALEVLRERKVKISLILLDLLVPETDGFKVMKAVSSEPDFERIPVIVLTSDKSAELKSLQMGASDFLAKPYDSPEVILARVRHLIALAEDIKLIKSTERDFLTKLYTKDFFYEYANQIKESNPHKIMDSVVLNLTNFHLINEIYGRDYGNILLQTIADEISKLAEESHGIGCRDNADVFYIYLEWHSSYDELLARIQLHLSELLKETEINVRMGVCRGDFPSISAQQSFDRALCACNTLRGNFESSFAVYDEKMHNDEIKKARLLSDFADAVDKRQFQVYYQPKYNIQGEKPALSSFEALVRWEHPEFGKMKPDFFITQFEKNGLIQKLDKYVWKEVAVQMRKWKELLGKTVPVSVNVSRVDLHDPKIVDYLLQITQENGIEPGEFLLEITESACLDDMGILLNTVNKMREAGFKVEMDDFGSGYSSLNMLAALPVDAIKIDIGFIRKIIYDEKTLYLVQVILAIAEKFNIPCIAEGVESKEQFDLLKEAGCDIVQGYYFSKPVPACDAAELLKF